MSISCVQTIALAGVGSLGRYLYEVLSQDNQYKVIVLSRQNGDDLKSTGIDPSLVRTTDYTEDSVLSILDYNHATALISTIQCADDDYVPIHTVLLSACLRSNTCKRLIPSEYAGNIEDYPDLPRAYAVTRTPFRDTLCKTEGIQWTSFNLGWFMDYFVAQEKTFIRHVPSEFPIDLKSWQYTVRGTGDELQSFTCARDVAKAIVELLKAPTWDQVTYVAGEYASFNDAAKALEDFYGRPLERLYRSEDDIKAALAEHEGHGGCEGRAIAEAEELTISGANCCPREKTLDQKARYFENVPFRSLREVLEKAGSSEKV
ncbi:NAD(P)-binding protein [Aspergillus karnatakaensis]|uniref:NAD(P)-binding protein n=1 Tax=Aspergillus karnatakaensis TaxID=1810916 RepID=UPI003CCDE835